MDTQISKVLKVKGNVVKGIEIGRSVDDAVKRMAELEICSLIVQNDGLMVGILTERDLARRCAAAEVDVATTLVEKVMTSPVAFISPTTLVQEALKVMSDTSCRHLPVFEDDELVGIVSMGDLLRWLTDELSYKVAYLDSYIRGR